MTRTTLADFRKALPGCELAVLVDFGARTVLLCDSALRHPQEHLDALEAEARQLFDSGLPPPVIVAGPRGLRVFLRGPGGTEALCCLMAPGTALDRLPDAAMALFAAQEAAE